MAKKREIERKLAAHRKSLHGQLVNQTLILGKHIKTEKVSVKAWQKNYGKSIGFKSPASFQSELVRKAESAGGIVLMFSTRKTALSQTCLCGNKQRKSLSQRVHHCSVCGLNMQRDILSA
ncbi:MAG: transposase [Calothrix sp. C42_A2020_038]|nr:transposase [Calothrix sp. C42_A2020_038]